MSRPMSAAAAPSPAEARVWDPVVRITHWGVAVAVLANGLITEGGDEIHVWIGYAMIGLLALRLIWGLIGTAEARFSAFPPSISAGMDHFRKLRRGDVTSHRSHNPLGALMVYAFWGVLSVMALTGVAMELTGGGERPEGTSVQTLQEDEAHETEGLASAGEGYEREDDEGEREDSLLGEVHETLANLLLAMAGLHVLGVAYEQRRSGVNLVRAMITGRKPVEGASP